MAWFKASFRVKIGAALQGTPFSLDLVTAIAIQETYWIWVKFYQDLPLDQTLMLCVGDSIGEPGRHYFPRTVQELKQSPNGDAMYQIARKAFEDIAAYVPDYQAKLGDHPPVFCHGYGIFQYDIQFFKTTNPGFFLNKKWGDFDACLKILVQELKDQQAGLYLKSKTTLTDLEQIHVAIAYNAGASKFVLARGLKQGRRDSNKPEDADKPDNKYYGEHIWDFLNASKGIP